MLLQIIYFIKLCTTICLFIFCKKYFTDEWLYTKLYQDIIDCGCITIKFTQWIISRINILYEKEAIPSSLNKFKNLLDQCPQHKYSYTKYIFYCTYGIDIEDLIILEKKPIASGSIGQVYKGYFRHNKEEIAIKIKHPNLKEQIFLPKYFILIITYILNLFESQYRIPIQLSDFFINLEEQLDFNYKRKNMDQLRKNFKNNHLVIIPKTYLSSKDILIMKYEDGTSLYDNKLQTYSKYKITVTLVLILKQGLLIDNFMHGDLHHKNWKIRPYNKHDYQIILYDTGLCYSSQDININRKFLIAWDTFNINMINTISLQILGYNTKNNIPQINELNSRLENTITGFISISKVIKITYQFVKENNLMLNGAYLNLVISLAIMEDIFKTNGIIPDDNELSVNIKEFNMQGYTDNINFCQTKKVFLELSNYLNEFVNNNLIDNNIKYYESTKKSQNKIQHTSSSKSTISISI